MADKIEANVQGAGTRVVSLHGGAAFVGGNDFRRAVALELAIISFPPGGFDTKDCIERAREFERFIKGDSKA